MLVEVVYIAFRSNAFDKASRLVAAECISHHSFGKFVLADQCVSPQHAVVARLIGKHISPVHIQFFSTHSENTFRSESTIGANCFAESSLNRADGNTDRRSVVQSFTSMR